MDNTLSALYVVGYCIALGIGVSGIQKDDTLMSRIVTIFSLVIVLPFLSWITVGYYLGVRIFGDE